MFILICKNCNKEFQAARSTYKMCSSECTSKFIAKKQTKYTEEEYQKAIALKLEGKITSEIVEITGIKKPTLQKLFRERGVKLTPEQLAKNTNRRWDNHDPIKDGKKLCGTCLLNKPIEEFYKSTNRLSGLTSGCQTCYKQMYAENKDIIKKRINRYRKENPEQVKASVKKYYEKNKDRYIEKAALWARENKEKALEISRRWGKNNQKHKNAKTALYRAQKLQATPVWLTPEQLEEMRQIYLNCPEGHHVDHIVPLNGENICGLHVPWNLQYLPAIENLKKGNKF